MLLCGGVGTPKGYRDRMPFCRDGTTCSSRLDFLLVPTTRVWTSLPDVIDSATLNSLRSQFVRAALWIFASPSSHGAEVSILMKSLKKPLMVTSVSLSD